MAFTTTQMVVFLGVYFLWEARQSLRLLRFCFTDQAGDQKSPKQLKASRTGRSVVFEPPEVLSYGVKYVTRSPASSVGQRYLGNAGDAPPGSFQPCLKRICRSRRLCPGTAAGITAKQGELSPIRTV